VLSSIRLLGLSHKLSTTKTLFPREIEETTNNQTETDFKQANNEFTNRREEMRKAKKYMFI
jgi:hypothetical protein